MSSPYRDYLRVNPPSTARTCPVIKDTSWLSRNTIVASTSSGAPIRPISERSVVQLGSSSVLLLSGVSYKTRCHSVNPHKRLVKLSSE